MQKSDRASDQEGLRLMLAFFRINSPAQRLDLIALAECFAAVPELQPRKSRPPILQDNRKPVRPKTRST
jgi:hypothetical protein